MVAFYVEPTQLSDADGILITHKTKLSQGGLFGGKPTVKIETTHLDGTFTSTFLISDLRQALDLLEPAVPPRKAKKVKRNRLGAGLATTVRKEGTHD